MMDLPFLVLAVLFWLPGLAIVALRPDLRRPVARMAVASLPFAFPELLFYPTYWQPRFLFDLVHVVGFGVEDVLFVTGLAAFTSTAYVFTTRRVFVARGAWSWPGVAKRGLGAIAGVFLIVGILALLDVPMIYGSCLIMVAFSAAMIAQRRDLGVPGLLGALLTTGLYTGLCLIFGALLPGIFELAWNTDAFLNRFVLGVPVEELMYGFCAGLAATVFYPWAFDLDLAPMAPRPLADAH